MGLHTVQIVSFAMMAFGGLGLVGFMLLARFAPDCSDTE